MWGGLTLAGSSFSPQWDREQDWKGEIKEFIKCKDYLGRQRNSKHSPFLFLPPIFIAEHLCHSESAVLGCSLPNSCAPSASVGKPKKALILQLKPPCAVSTALVTKPEPQRSCSEGNEMNPSQTQQPVVCHSFWWWQPVPAVCLWFMVVVS